MLSASLPHREFIRGGALTVSRKKITLSESTISAFVEKTIEMISILLLGNGLDDKTHKNEVFKFYLKLKSDKYLNCTMTKL